MLIVPVPTPEDVAERYDLPLEDLKAWLDRTQNARLLGSIDSPAIQGEVRRFRLCAALSDDALLEYWAFSTGDARDHYRNEVQGRGLLREECYTGRAVRNVMGGGNVIVKHVRWRATFVVSYSTPSNARRALRSGAAIRRAIQTELDAR